MFKMSKEKLYVLIEKMNDTTPHSNRANKKSWKAHRKAEKISDPAVFAIIKEIIEENDHKKNVQKRNVRKAAYFIGGKLLKRSFDYNFCNFFIQRLCVESNKYVLSSILDRLEEFDIVGDCNIEPVLDCAKSEAWLIRYSAISALGSFNTIESRECLRAFVRLEDEKKNEYEIIYAQAALGRNGEKEDIELLQLHANSRKHDIKDSACFAQERLKEKYNVGTGFRWDAQK